MKNRATLLGIAVLLNACVANVAPPDLEGPGNVGQTGKNAGSSGSSGAASKPGAGSPEGGIINTAGPEASTTGETCGDGVDNDGNGQMDEGCPCNKGVTQGCYPGAADTRGVGACRDGVQTCQGGNEFAQWGPCEGAVVPSEEQCGDGVDNDCDGTVDEECTPEPVAQLCNAATMTHVVGAADCAQHHAVYMMDDGDGPNFICCPLPSTDILLPGQPQTRAGQCLQNEVITGAAGPSTFHCSAINTARYELRAPGKPCYFGSGYAGAQGVAKCASQPYSFTVLQQNYFGSDGCSGQPYGALFVKQTGSDCADMLASQLVYKGTVPGDPPANTPVIMYAE